MPTVKLKKSRASAAAGSLGGGSATAAANFNDYKQQLKIQQQEVKINKASEKSSEKALQLRQKFEKERAKQSEQERLLEEASARKRWNQDKKNFAQRLSDEATARNEAAKQQLETALSSGASMGTVFKSAVGVAATSFASTATKALENAGQALGSLLTSASASVEESLDLYTKYMTQIDARIQGAYSNMDFESINDLISSNIAGNPYVTYEEVMESLAELVEKGVAENLTQRAFIDSISDKIATTFDAMDDTLLRIIRIQNQDTTAARLGMEAELTKLFNYYFSDTSYLSEAFDSVTDALVDLSAQLSATTSVEVEYQIQKWLGALSEAGVDSSTVVSIAEAINALGTGDIETLNSDEGMRNLLVLAMNRAGLNFGELLLNGITSSDVNSLMYNMIYYLQETLSGQNNVVKAQYASLFDITMADVAAIQSLSTSTIDSLYQQAMTYEDTLTSLNQQIAEIPNRMHMSTMIDNVMSNIMAATGMSIANSETSYLIYKVADMVESITGGIEIPTIGVLGSFIGLPNSIEEYMKIGVTGLGLISSLSDALGNWVSGSMLSLDKWAGSWSKASSYSGFVSTNQLSTQTSASGFVTNSDSTGIQQSIVDEQTSSAEEITGTEVDEDSGEEIKELIQEIRDYLLVNNASNPLKVSMVRTAGITKESDGSLSYTYEEIDIASVVQSIYERLSSMGTNTSPMVVSFSTLYNSTI